ncbi:hypothetical protein ABZ442_30465 [Streptomyces triculaminicus]|uniref:hypothetical protein n=1 Tax=Streptomyces triculaminicus TaxID=2816232 RepID=UPI0033C833D3
MPDSAVDVSALGLVFRHRPVVSASLDLTRAHADMEELGISITAGFGPLGEWCEVGNDLHTVTSGDWEIRLRLEPHTAAWHADYFGAAWGSGAKFEGVPAEYRVEVAAYVDRLEEVEEALLQEATLRAAAADGGPAAVDALVRHRVVLLDEQFAVLDRLHSVLITHAGTLPAWALQVVRREAEGLNSAREWLTSAVTAYHHGSAGRRPDTLFGGVVFEFSGGSVELCAQECRCAGGGRLDTGSHRPHTDSVAARFAPVTGRSGSAVGRCEIRPVAPGVPQAPGWVACTAGAGEAGE